MGTQRENLFDDEYFKKIETLAALSVYGQNVKIAIHRIAKDACHSAAIKADDPKAYLLALKGQLTALADRTHPSMPGYKKTLEYAASLLVIR